MSVTRLPDHYYTTQNLDAQPAKPGIKQLSAAYAQGEDMVMNVMLFLDGQPVDESKYILDVLVKKNVYANNVLWHGKLGEGLQGHLNNVPGYFQIWMPAAITSLFLPGTYFMDIKAQEKTGQGQYAKDRTFPLFSVLFNITLSAMSPHPKLRPEMLVETVYNIETGEFTYTLQSVEPTMPLGTDTIGTSNHTTVTILAN